MGFNDLPATLGQAQRLFNKLISQFVVDVYLTMPGYEFTDGEAYRTPEQAAWNVQHGTGIADSLHTKRLARDMNLFINGNYQANSSAYAILGTKWKQYHALCRWGGDFVHLKDANHFSLSWEGVA